MPFIPSHEWGLQSDITPRFGARLIQEGNRLHYLADRVGLTRSFSPEQLQKLEQTSLCLSHNWKICCVPVISILVGNTE